MKIKIQTLVQGNFLEVYKRFDQTLFVKLAPPLVKLNLTRFDGCKTGDEVHLDMSFLGQKNRWVSKIVKNGETSYEKYFVDEGEILPVPLKHWRHKHLIVKSGSSKCFIIDDINYTTDIPPLDLLIYPILYLSFLYRKPVYRRHFNHA